MRKLDSPNITQELLKSILEYNPNSGLWYWINPSKYAPHKKGKRAGYITKRHKKSGITISYYGVTINGGKYYFYRLAFLYMTGYWPENCVDHINGISTDDRWINLREATYSENCMNKTWKTKSSGLPFGVYKKRTKYGTKIQKNGIIYNLGVFDTPEEAFSVYVLKRRELFGEYNRI